MAASNRRPDSDPEPNQDFFESIPYTDSALPHVTYYDDRNDEQADLPDISSGRLTALIALVLLAIVAVATGLLLAWGFSSLQGTNPTTPNNAVLEL